MLNADINQANINCVNFTSQFKRQPKNSRESDKEESRKPNIKCWWLGCSVGVVVVVGRAPRRDAAVVRADVKLPCLADVGNRGTTRRIVVATVRVRGRGVFRVWAGLGRRKDVWAKEFREIWDEENRFRCLGLFVNSKAVSSRF